MLSFPSAKGTLEKLPAIKSVTSIITFIRTPTAWLEACHGEQVAREVLRCYFFNLIKINDIQQRGWQ